MKVIKLGRSAPAAIGEQEHAFIYVCGAWEEGTQYRPGAMVKRPTAGGGVAIYVAERTTTEEPPHADWFLMTEAAQGSPGTSAPPVSFQYSTNGVTEWSPAWTGQKYMRCSVDGGSTWGSAYKFIGDDGDGAGNVLCNALESTDEEIVLMDGPSARVIKGSGVSLDDLATSEALSSHNHNDIYAPISHSHDYASSSHNHDGTYAPASHIHDTYATKDGWTFYGAVTTGANPATFSVENNGTNEAIFAPGRPLKMVSGGTEHYVLVVTWSSGTVTVMGSAPTAYTSYNVDYGAFEKLVQVDFNLPGTFAASYSNSALEAVSGDYFFWGLAPARLVGMQHRLKLADTAATTANPKVNVFLGTPSSSTSITGSGTVWAINARTIGDTLSISDDGTLLEGYEVNFATGAVVLSETPTSLSASYQCWTAADQAFSANLEVKTYVQDTGITAQKDYVRILREDRVELLVEPASGGTPGDDSESLGVSLFFVME